MNAKFRLILLVFLLPAATAFAGAWGIKSFENDDARDWVGNELKENCERAVRSAIGAVVRIDGHLDDTPCSYAVAACEVLAAARGKPSSDLPKEVAALAKTLPAAVVDALRADAVKALEKIAAKSELRNLWEESGSLAVWLKLMDELKERLK